MKSHKNKGRRFAWPRIHIRKLRSGQTVWVIDTQVAGERIFRRFPTAQKAEDFATDLRAQRQTEGEAAFSIPAALRIQAIESAKMLNPSRGAKPGSVPVVHRACLEVPQPPRPWPRSLSG